MLTSFSPEKDTIALHPGMIAQVARLDDAARVAARLQALGWPVTVTDDPQAARWSFGCMGNLVRFEKDLETIINELWPPLTFMVEYDPSDTGLDIEAGAPLFTDEVRRPLDRLQYRPHNYQWKDQQMRDEND